MELKDWDQRGRRDVDKEKTERKDRGVEKKVGEKGGETEQSNQEKAGWGG